MAAGPFRVQVEQSGDAFHNGVTSPTERTPSKGCEAPSNHSRGRYRESRDLKEWIPDNDLGNDEAAELHLIFGIALNKRWILPGAVLFLISRFLRC